MAAVVSFERARDIMNRSSDKRRATSYDDNDRRVESSLVHARDIAVLVEKVKVTARPVRRTTPIGPTPSTDPIAYRVKTTTPYNVQCFN
jgi:hypothetical protein